MSFILDAGKPRDQRHGPHALVNVAQQSHPHATGWPVCEEQASALSGSGRRIPVLAPQSCPQYVLPTAFSISLAANKRVS